MENIIKEMIESANNHHDYEMADGVEIVEKCKTCAYSTWNESIHQYDCRYANYEGTKECSVTYEEQ